MKNKPINFRRVFVLLSLVLCLSHQNFPALAQTIPDPSPPNETIKLIFIHHSVGENWLADDQGGLGLALQLNNYFVSDTYYGWGPDGIGDRTDTLDWPLWFTNPDSQRYMNAAYTESDANAAGHTYFTRTITDPGGENQVIVFKSCFPNSDLGGKPNDPPAPGNDLTVSSAKYTYNQLLKYFASRSDKLFILITSPPMQRISKPENARALSNWLVNDWLSENDYPLNNVAVFDFYNILTHPDNHHRYKNGAIEHITNGGSNTLYYDSSGDDHPNAVGGQKATAEFIPLLNIYVNRWLSSDPHSISPNKPTQAETQEVTQTQLDPMNAVMIDDFELGPIPETDYWVPYLDEAVSTTIQCGTTTNRAYRGASSLEIDFNVLTGSWASCELLYFAPNNWSGEGLQFYLHANQANLPFGVLFYYQLGNEKATSSIELYTEPENVGEWNLITIPWSRFAGQDSIVYPESGLGIAITFGESNDGEANIGTIWLDDLSTYSTVPEPYQQENEPVTQSEEPVITESAQNETTQNDQTPLPFCGNFPLIIFLIGSTTFIFFDRRAKKIKFD